MGDGFVLVLRPRPRSRRGQTDRARGRRRGRVEVSLVTSAATKLLPVLRFLAAIGFPVFEVSLVTSSATWLSIFLRQSSPSCSNHVVRRIIGIALAIGFVSSN